MAGDWIRYTVGLEDKPTVFRMAERLGLECDLVAMACLRVWGWASENASIPIEDIPPESVDALSASCPHLVRIGSGQLSAPEEDEGRAMGVVRCGKPLIDRVARYPGFAEAMIEEGWLDELPGGLLVFASWETHNSKSAKRRMLEAKRKAKSRGSSTPVRKESASRPHSVRNVSASDADKSVTREEKRREEHPPTTSTMDVRVDEPAPPPKTPPAPPRGGGGKTGGQPNPPPPDRLSEPDLLDRELVTAFAIGRLGPLDEPDLEGLWRLALYASRTECSSPCGLFVSRLERRQWPAESEVPPDPFAYSDAMAKKTRDLFDRLEQKAKDAAPPEEARKHLDSIRQSLTSVVPPMRKGMACKPAKPKPEDFRPKFTEEQLAERQAAARAALDTKDDDEAARESDAARVPRKRPEREAVAA